MDTKPLGLSEQALIERVGYLATIDEAGLLGECVQFAQCNDKHCKNYSWESHIASLGREHLVEALERCYRVPRELARRAVAEWSLGERSPLAVTEDVVDMYLQIARRMLHHRCSEGEREFPPEDLPPESSPHLAGRTQETSSDEVPDKIRRERARRRA